MRRVAATAAQPKQAVTGMAGGPTAPGGIMRAVPSEVTANLSDDI